MEREKQGPGDILVTSLHQAIGEALSTLVHVMMSTLLKVSCLFYCSRQGELRQCNEKNVHIARLSGS